MTTTHVSTSATLFLKLIFPTLWVVFFGVLWLGSWFSGYNYFGPFSANTFLTGLGLFFIAGVSILYWVLFRIKRVDMDKDGFYVTNYFKHYRYTYDSLANIQEREYGLFLVIDLILHQPGSFGKKITFVASRKRYKDFLESHPSVFTGLLNQKL